MAVDSIEVLIENFELFDNWEEKYGYLIDLGKQLPPMDDSLKTYENVVKGCVSKVWLSLSIGKDHEGRRKLSFVADSDAVIVKGLIYILMSAYLDKSVDEVSAVDINEAFDKLGLSEHLSPNRRNGFFAMVGVIQNAARQAAA